MIVLDTNVVSEVLRPRPDPTVLAWLDRLPVDGAAVTAITVGELLYGVARLPAGRRRARLGEAVVDLLEQDFGTRILPYDAAAAERYAEIVVDREASGRPIASADAQIAAVCASRDVALATRNGRDFAGTGITVVDPWAGH